MSPARVGCNFPSLIDMLSIKYFILKRYLILLPCNVEKSPPASVCSLLDQGGIFARSALRAKCFA